jgi:two-component system, NarL family, nitrate/nitrite response regulator NarL
VRLIIFSPELLFAEALASLLGRRGHRIVSCPSSESELMTTVASGDADALLIDLSSDAVASTVRVIKERAEGSIPIVVLHAEANAALLQSALATGAAGVCLKIDPVEEIERVLERSLSVSGGSTIMSNAARLQATRRALAPKENMLTPKERSVLLLLIKGTSTAEIANQLGVSEATVRTHLQHLFSKFGVHSRIALAAAAVRTGVATINDTEMRVVSR